MTPKKSNSPQIQSQAINKPSLTAKGVGKLDKTADKEQGASTANSKINPALQIHTPPNWWDLKEKELLELYDKNSFGFKIFSDSRKEHEKEMQADLDYYYQMCYSSWVKFLDYVTHGRMSKPNYTYEAMKEVFDEQEEEKLKRFEEEFTKDMVKISDFLKYNGRIKNKEDVFHFVERLLKCSNCNKDFYDKRCPTCYSKEGYVKIEDIVKRLKSNPRYAEDWYEAWDSDTANDIINEIEDLAQKEKTQNE